MKSKHLLFFYILVINFTLLSGCATFRSEMTGEFKKETDKNYRAKPVSVLFLFSHYNQSIGYDAIPKLESHYKINGFNDILIDAMTELSNVRQYEIFTESSNDINNPKRRALKDSLKQAHDYVMHIKFMKDHSFAKYFLGSMVSTVSATVLPIPYTVHYTMKLDLYNNEDVLIQSYQRKSELTKWWQTFLMFVYPFHTEKREIEEVYITFFHDVFRQIETEKVLEFKP